MVFFGVFNNLKAFAISRPPLVIFTLCLTALAIATLSLARMVSDAESLPNPDINLDWNLLLARMAGLELCIIPAFSKDVASILAHAGIANSSGSSSTLPVDGNAESASVSARLGVAKELHGHGLLHNNTLIVGTIPPVMLGLRGSQNITVSFRMDGTNHTADPEGHGVCASFFGPKTLLPTTRVPPSCLTSPDMNTAGGVAVLKARPQGPQMVDDWCENQDGTLLRLSYHSNPSLTAVLTLHDRSVVNLHLMHTSYFLLVMAMTLVCYALLKGKSSASGKTSSVTIEKVPLDP